MTSKTFFFRESYSIKEMEERIYAEDFIKVFKGYAGYVDDEEDIEVNKLNCFRGLMTAFLGDRERLTKEMKSCFNAYGRKGDKLNVKLYVLEEFNYIFSEAIKNRIEDILENERNIKEIDSLSPGLRDNVFIKSVNESENKIDFKFKIEQIYINTNLEVPAEEIRSIYVECRLYLNTGIVAVFNPNGTFTNTKNVLSIIHLLFKGHAPRFYEVNLDEAQLIMINLRLNGQISAPKFTSKDELRIDIYGLNPGNQGNPFVKFVGDSHLEIYELSMKAVIQGHRCTVRLNAEGKIQVETYVTPEVLDSIILELDWVIFTKDYYIDYRDQLDKFFKQINRGSLQALRNRKIKEVEDELVKLISTHTQRSLVLKEIKLVTTIIYNIAKKLINADSYKFISQEIDESGKELISTYTAILEFLSKYMVINKNQNKSDADKNATYILSYIHNLIMESNGDGVKIIDDYEEWLQCQTTTIQEVR